jgi:hypothetical protein
MKNKIQSGILSTIGMLLLAFPLVVYQSSSFFFFGEAETPEFLIED